MFQSTTLQGQAGLSQELHHEILFFDDLIDRDKIRYSKILPYISQLDVWSDSLIA